MIALAACGGVEVNPASSGLDATTSDAYGDTIISLRDGSGDVRAADAAPDIVALDDGGADAADARDLDSTVDAADVADAPFDAGCVPDEPAPATGASTGTVSFVVANQTGSDRFVLTQAALCAAFSINGVRTMVDWSCGCNCHPALDQYYFKHLAPGESVTLTWDGRGLVEYATWTFCNMPNGPLCGEAIRGAPRPVMPGQYQVEVISADSVPVGMGTGCLKTSPNGDVQCGVGPRSGPPPRRKRMAFNATRASSA